MESRKERIFKNTCVVNGRTKKILSIKVTDEYIQDSKALSELVEDIIKSEGMSTTTGKLFGDDAYEGKRFLGIWEIMEFYHALK
jgi:hypothetical protein